MCGTIIGSRSAFDSESAYSSISHFCHIFPPSGQAGYVDIVVEMGEELSRRPALWLPHWSFFTRTNSTAQKCMLKLTFSFICGGFVIFDIVTALNFLVRNILWEGSTSCCRRRQSNAVLRWHSGISWAIWPSYPMRAVVRSWRSFFTYTTPTVSKPQLGYRQFCFAIQNDFCCGTWGILTRDQWCFIEQSITNGMKWTTNDHQSWKLVTDQLVYRVDLCDCDCVQAMERSTERSCARPWPTPPATMIWPLALNRSTIWPTLSLMPLLVRKTRIHWLLTSWKHICSAFRADWRRCGKSIFSLHFVLSPLSWVTQHGRINYCFRSEVFLTPPAAKETLKKESKYTSPHLPYLLSWSYFKHHLLEGFWTVAYIGLLVLFLLWGTLWAEYKNRRSTTTFGQKGRTSLSTRSSGFFGW